MKPTAIVLLALGLILAIPPSGAQDGGGSPHGDDFDLDCVKCHSEEGWTPIRKKADFKHSEVGRSLAGSHKRVACRSCHLTLEFAHVGGACADCHRDVHRGEFGFHCETCHVAKSWDNRRQMWDNHAKTLFPLNGAHATLDCGVCHFERSPFQYALTPTECFSCHADDYAGTTDPDHQIAGFPTDCRLCHGTQSWDPLGFPQHDAAYFPINSGTHAGEWDTCTDCHTMSGVFNTFECIFCHAHGEGEMGRQHEGEDGYAWDSDSCYSCHPRGVADDD
jgi:hypothetical protein